MKYGVPFMIARGLLAIVVGYIMLKFWPAFGQLSYL